MNQERYNHILSQLVDYEDIQAMNKLWRKYLEYKGAVMYQTPREVKFVLNIDLDDKTFTLTPPVNTTLVEGVTPDETK
jgi:hypothetical protein